MRADKQQTGLIIFSREDNSINKAVDACSATCARTFIGYKQLAAATQALLEPSQSCPGCPVKLYSHVKAERKRLYIHPAPEQFRRLHLERI